MNRLLALLLVALAGCNSADADELLFGSPTGSGVVSIPFDSSQAAGCMSWDGTNIDTHPSNPNCDGGSGGGSPVPTVTPFDCGSGLGVQGMNTTPICVPLSTPKPSLAPVPTQTPWACGTGAVAIGMGAGAPTCAILPTPDGAGGGSPVAGNYIDVTGSTIDFDPTEIGSSGSAVTWGSPADAPVTWTFDTAGGDPAMTYSNGGLTFANTPDANDLVFGVHGGVVANTVTTPQLNATTQAYLDGGATIQFEGATPDGFETTVTVTDPTVDRTLTLPNETGTVCTTGSVCSSYQAGPLSGDVVTSGAAATIQANSVALGTDTTNDYVATVSGSSGVSCTGTGETAAVACTATLGTTIAPTEMASSDFGSFTCNGTTCSLDSNTVTNAEVTDASLVYADINNLATLAGNPTNGASSAWTATTGFIFEGATSDTIEGLLTAADPTSTDKTWTLPDETGTICTTGSVCTGYQATHTAGNYIDVSGASIAFDPTEVGSATDTGAVTWGDNTQTAFDWTMALSGSTDPQVNWITGNVTFTNSTVTSRAAAPAFNLLDSDIPKTAGQVTGACDDSSNCTVAMSYEDTGLKNLISGAGTGSTIVVGSANAASVTVTTDGTGTAEVALPAGSIDSTEILDGTVDISTDTNLTASGGVTLTGDNLTADLGTSVDISAETNLAVTAPIVLTGDTLSITDADDDGTTKGAVAFDNADFDCAGGVCSLAETYMVVGDTIQPSQLSRIAANDQTLTLGTNDLIGVKYNSTLKQLAVTYTAPTPAAVATPAVAIYYPSTISASQEAWSWLNNGIRQLSVLGNGSLLFGSDAAHTISTETNASGVGRALTISAGSSSLANNSGGALALTSGTGVSTGVGGDITITTGGGLTGGAITLTNGAGFGADISLKPTSGNLNLQNDNNNIVAVGRTTIGGIAGGSLTVQSGGTKSGQTDKAAGQLILSPGLSTGTGEANVSIKDNTRALSTGTSDNTAIDRAIFGGGKALTDNTNTALVNFTLAADTSAATIVRYAVDVVDATNHKVQSEVGSVVCQVINSNGTFLQGGTSGCTKVAGSINTVTASAGGTLTVTWTMTAANPAVLTINADTATITPTTGYPRVTYSFDNLTNQAVAVQ